MSKCPTSLQKVHMFQKSLEAVLDRLGDAERGQSTLNTIGANANNESDIQVFRNQLKVSTTCAVNANGW